MPTGLAGVFHFLGIFASGSLRCVLGGKASIALQHGVIGAADFVEALAPLNRMATIGDWERYILGSKLPNHRAWRDPLLENAPFQ